MTATPRRHIRFLLNDREIVLNDIAPTVTLLDFLRLDRRLTGTKEGCAEGDCGACTVLVGRLADGELRYETVTACIRFVGSLDATHVVTVEHLAGPDGRLHPVQQAMVDQHGSQCGFCTPGFVMSLYALWLETPRPRRPEIEKALQGNLCRCTGYEAIVRAAEAMGATLPSADVDRLTAERDDVAARLESWRDGRRVEIGEGDARSIVPADLDDFAGIYAENPKATIIAGSTDVGLWVTKQMRPVGPAIFIAHLEELRHIEETAEAISLGACVSYTEAAPVLSRHFPAMRSYLDRIGGEQVRNMGTIGGNIANGSPIGDMPPALIALGATLTLRRGAERRTLPLEDFFVDYGRQDRKPGELVERVDLPRLGADTRFAVYKIAKRRDEDISAVAGAFNISIAHGRVQNARIAFGGMAATPKRARHVEAALVGEPWNERAIEAAAAAFETDYQPLTDWRASAGYRMLAAKNLLRRFYREERGETVQLVRHAPEPAEA